MEELSPAGVFARGDVAHLLEQGHVHVAFDVALSPRIPVPVPRPSEVAALFDYLDISDSPFEQLDRDQLSAITSADDERLAVLLDGVPSESG